MTSMISYFGLANCDCEPDKPSGSSFCWDGKVDLGTNLNRMKCPIGQLKFLLEQELAAAYYVKMYGLRCHEMISDYIDELNTDVCGRFARTCGRSFTDNFRRIYNIVQDLVHFTRGGNWTKIDVGLVSEFLFDGNNREGVPVVWGAKDKGYLIPFIIWMNQTFTADQQEYADEHCGVVSFRLSFCHESFRVSCNFHHIGRSFSAVKTPIDDLKSIPVLALLSHFDWSTTTFEQCVGVLCEYCIHDDIGRYGISLSHILAHSIKLGAVYPVFDIDGSHTGIFPVMPSIKYQLFNALLMFVGYCTKSKGMQMVDKNIVAKAFGCIASTKEQKESVAYLMKSDAVASADEYKSFKQTMSSIEAFRLISQNPTLITAQTGSQVTGSTEAADPADGNKDNTSEQPNKDQAADDTKSGDQNAGQKESGEGDDNSEPSSDDDGSDDMPADDTPDTDQTDDAFGAEGGESGDSDASGDLSVPSEDTPQEPSTSDDKGIPFTIVPPDSSTVDSVLFREEMYKFLSNVLTNPPKCLSPQDIDTLNALRKYWLSCLSIDTIKGIVEACIRLPKSINNSIHPKVENQQ